MCGGKFTGNQQGLVLAVLDAEKYDGSTSYTFHKAHGLVQYS